MSACLIAVLQAMATYLCSVAKKWPDPLPVLAEKQRPKFLTHYHSGLSDRVFVKKLNCHEFVACGRPPALTPECPDPGSLS